MSDDMKLIEVSAGEMRSGGFYLSLGFGSHPCELVSLSLRLAKDLSAADVVAALRDMADRAAGLKSEGEELREALKEEAFRKMLSLSPEMIAGPRRGPEKDPRRRRPRYNRRNPMANKKTAKKVAKKVEAKKAAMKKVVAKKAK